MYFSYLLHKRFIIFYYFKLNDNIVFLIFAELLVEYILILIFIISNQDLILIILYNNFI